MDNMIYTIGHSTHPLKEFIDIIKAYDINYVIDVRSVPRSRHTPQFNKHSLVQTLPKQSVGYQHLKELGGLRHTKKDSLNIGWHNASFRGYADYMQTNEFQTGLNALIKLSETKTIVIMCAEAVPWRCHRSLIGDALLVRDYKVNDIYSKTKYQPEKLTSFARVDALKLTYPNDKKRR